MKLSDRLFSIRKHYRVVDIVFKRIQYLTLSILILQVLKKSIGFNVSFYCFNSEDFLLGLGISNTELEIIERGKLMKILTVLIYVLMQGMVLNRQVFLAHVTPRFEVAQRYYLLD